MNKAATNAQLLVVYDGECNLCLATVAKLRQMPSRATLGFVPLQQLLSGEAEMPAALAALPPAELAGQMHVVDAAGHRSSGSDGILLLMRHSPSLIWLGRLGSWPGFRVVSRLLYKLVAKHRYRLFGKTDCSDGVCSLPRRPDVHGGKGNDH